MKQLFFLIALFSLNVYGQTAKTFSGEWNLDNYTTTFPDGKTKQEFISKEFSEPAKRNLKIAEGGINIGTPCNQLSFDTDMNEEGEMEFSNELSTRVICGGRELYWERLIIQSWKNFTGFEIVNNTLQVYCKIDNNTATFVYTKASKK